MAKSYTVQGQTFDFHEGVSHQQAMQFIRNYQTGTKMVGDKDIPKIASEVPKVVDDSIPTLEDVKRGENLTPKMSFGEEASRQLRRVPGFNMATDIVGGINKGGMSLADLPFNIANLALAVAGAPQLKPPSQYLDDIILEDGSSLKDIATKSVKSSDPGKFVGRVAEEVAFMASGIGMAQKGAKVLDGALRGNLALHNGSSFYKTFSETPTNFLLRREMAPTIGAGLGAATAQQVAPDSIGAEIAGSLIGGVAGNNPTVAAKLWRQVKKQTTDPFTDAGVRQRVSDFLITKASDPEEAIRNIQANKALLGGSHGEGLRLSSDILSQDAGLMQAFSSLSAKDPKLLGMLTRMERQSREALAPKFAEALPEGRPDAVIDSLESRIKRASDQFDQYSALLDKQVAARLSTLKSPEPSEALSLEFFDKVKDGMRAGREMESQIWSEIKGASKISTKALKKEFKAIRKQIPKVMKKENIPTEEFKLVEDVLKGKDSIQEVITLRSQLLEEGRKARAAGAFAKARILGDLEGAVNDFIQRTGDLGVEYRRAADFSRNFHERFTRGSIGKILGYDTAGGEKINPEEVLRTLIKQNEKGAANAADIKRLMSSSDGMEGLKELEAPMYNYIRDSFAAAGDDVTKQLTWLDKYGPLLRQFPDLEKQLVNQNKGFERVAQRKAALENRRATELDKGLVKLANRVGTDPYRVGDRILNMDATELNSLKEALRGDELALNGMRHAVTNNMIERIFRSGIPDLTPIFKERKYQVAYQNILTPQQRKFFTEMDRLSKLAFTKRPSSDTSVKIPMPMLGSLMQRVAGSSAAGGIASKLGLKTGLIAAQQGSNFSRKLFEGISDAKAVALLERAAVDPQMLEDLLSPTLAKNPKEIERRLQLWLLNAGFKEEDEE